MIISVKREDYLSVFDGEEYAVNLSRKMDDYTPGDLICYVAPFAPDLPLTLEIAIRVDGSIAFRKWDFSGRGNHYLHTTAKAANDPDIRPFERPFVPSAEQIDTVNGLFSGRIRFEGLKLDVGHTVQLICPINVAREEVLTGKKIYLA